MLALLLMGNPSYSEITYGNLSHVLKNNPRASYMLAMIFIVCSCYRYMNPYTVLVELFKKVRGKAKRTNNACDLKFKDKSRRERQNNRKNTYKLVQGVEVKNGNLDGQVRVKKENGSAEKEAKAKSAVDMADNTTNIDEKEQAEQQKKLSDNQENIRTKNLEVCSNNANAGKLSTSTEAENFDLKTKKGEKNENDENKHDGDIKQLSDCDETSGRQKNNNSNKKNDDFFTLILKASAKTSDAGVNLKRANKRANRKVQALINRGVNVDQRNVKNNTPLMFASSRGLFSFVRAFCNKGADINLTNDEGNTALHCAVQSEHFDVVKLLLEKKVGINVQNNYGNTALHCAVQKEHLDAVKLLLEEKADINLKNNSDGTVLDNIRLNISHYFVNSDEGKEAVELLGSVLEDSFFSVSVLNKVKTEVIPDYTQVKKGKISLSEEEKKQYPEIIELLKEKTKSRNDINYLDNMLYLLQNLS